MRWPAVDLNRELEALITDVAPSIIGAKSAQAVLRLASERRLPDLHAVAASALYSVAEAARAQIKMEGTDRRARGLTLALRNATPEELRRIRYSRSAIRHLLDLAAAAVARRPGLLATVDMGMAAGQALWAAGLAKNPSVWSGPNDPAAVASQVLTNMLDGGPLDQGLVEALCPDTACAISAAAARRARLYGKTER